MLRPLTLLHLCMALCLTGQDNESDLCSTGDVPTIFQGDEDDHDGPYDGVQLGSFASALCT